MRDHARGVGLMPPITFVTRARVVEARADRRWRQGDPGRELSDVRGAGIPAYGSPLQLLELPELEISDPHQILIAVRAAGVGNWDDIVRTGG